MFAAGYTVHLLSVVCVCLPAECCVCVCVDLLCWVCVCVDLLCCVCVDRLCCVFAAGYTASLQDRFLVMAAEMENNGTQDLSQFWKEVPRANIVEHRYRTGYSSPATEPPQHSLKGKEPSYLPGTEPSSLKNPAFYRVLNPAP